MFYSSTHFQLFQCDATRMIYCFSSRIVVAYNYVISFQFKKSTSGGLRCFYRKSHLIKCYLAIMSTILDMHLKITTKYHAKVKTK